ncbi:hypothetical protein J7L68_07905 [bacterium]|nr:hypothetical protein [bacterium]
MGKTNSKIFLPINLNDSEPQKSVCISSIFDAVAKIFPDNVSKYGLWFLSAAKSRTNFDPLFDFDNRRGLFALSQIFFDDICKWLGIQGKSIFDPLANSLAAVKYIRWAMDKYEKYIPDERERFSISFLSLDYGYFRTKKAIEKTVEPKNCEKVKIIINK